LCGKPRPFLLIRSNHFAEHSLVTLLAFSGTMTDAPTLRITVQLSAENGLDRQSQA
jgi:mRNA interferase MazF